MTVLLATSLVALARPASAADTLAPSEPGTIVASALTSNYYEFVKVTVSRDQIVVEAVRADTNAVVDSTTITA